MYKNAKRGWYKIVNFTKYIPPKDNHMKSFNEATGEIEYKSNLELQFFKYCDYNHHIKHFSIEPFFIPYLSPKDNKVHRYFIDGYVHFTNGKKFLVEVKSSGEVKPPRKPKRVTAKSEKNYRLAIQTWLINNSKWDAARKYCESKDLKFIILTENELT